ncbi:MAG: hypothetical protein RL198_291 [Actinomycetota bacterium]
MQDKSDPGHGNTVASWTTVIVLMVATAIGTFFFFLDMPVMVWASAGLGAVGLLVGYVLRKRGLGAINSSSTTH